MNKQQIINADMFIIPNSAGKVNFEYSFCANRARKTISKINEANGLKLIPEDTIFVETWWCNKDSDNIIRHGIKIEGGFLDRRELAFLENIPLDIIKDIKEGETFTIKVNNLRYTENDDELVDVVFNLTARQKDYRYRNFGAFEECLRYVLS